ncbi:hypothetical protein [Schinkia azotoformans]|uniref:hypothetical protein n=1 Tax=Schinkia azotoformans TaxID=1454 RepID=UPI002DBD3CC2|nr:hypothetical protein [Schinkia azotoformans]MEC1780049.1 hypothetical protein [Schinkia azotoformans]MED4330872.1 hypothetical protein [Schinkia azotoformans]
MGRQQSFVKFNDIEVLKQELVNYKNRDKSNDNAQIIGVVEVIKEIHPFNKGDYALIVGGERYEQRNKANLKEGLGINNVDKIVFIDNPNYCLMAQAQKTDLGEILDTHFKSLDENSYKELGLVNPWE